jgi:hypothetical protein
MVVLFFPVFLTSGQTEPLVFLGSSNLNPFQGHNAGVFGGLGVKFLFPKKLSLEVNGLYKRKR